MFVTVHVWLKFACYHLGVLFSTWCKGSSAQTKWSAVEIGGLLINSRLKFKVRVINMCAFPDKVGGLEHVPWDGEGLGSRSRLLIYLLN